MYRHLSRFRLRRADLTRIPLLLAIGIGLLFLGGGMARAEEAPILEARVSKILDGDTFTPVSYTHLTLPTNREV